MDLGIQTITDNWLLQHCAELLSQSEDPLDSAHWIRHNHSDRCIDAVPVKRGVLQLQSLACLLEQIVFSDTLFVMEGWTEHWSGMSLELDALLQLGFIKDIPMDTRELQPLQAKYIDAMCHEPYLRAIHERSVELFNSGEPQFEGQVIAGTAPYLALSENRGLTYCPHPVRAKYLESELFLHRWPLQAIDEYEHLVNEVKVQMFRRRSHDREILTLLTTMPSIALFCLLNCDQNTSPIRTACQLRSDDTFKQFRSFLHEIQMNIDDGDTKAKVAKCRLLKKAVDDTAKRLGVAQQDRDNGQVSVNFLGFGLSVKAPEWLDTPLKRPLHSSTIYKLLAINEHKNLDNALRKAFGLRSKTLLQEWLVFCNA